MSDSGRIGAIENLVYGDLREKNQEIQRERQKINDLQESARINNDFIAQEIKNKSQTNKLIDNLQETIKEKNQKISELLRDLNKEKEGRDFEKNAFNVFKEKLFVLIAGWQISQKTYKNLYQMKAQELGMSEEEIEAEKEKMKKIIEEQEVELVEVIKKFDKSAEKGETKESNINQKPKKGIK